jgi:hypothetical protein
MKPQKAQMAQSEERHRLDDAIDAIAARLTHVDDDPAMVSQIVNALPERATWFGWLFHSWAPRLAVGVLAVGASFIVLRTSDERSTDVLRAEATSAPMVELRAAVEPTVVERPLAVHRAIVERPQNDRGTIDAPDFDRSLPAMSAVAALELDSLAPRSLPEDAPLTLAPLAIADLPLTAEPISPR